ncbi:major facilitator superfamily domain-containing protein [Glomus cerebriforme]|uniref:Major facilitator superfamily domain-containing protein n=1 Tax=Glomus cerebriforme TaxID=658196 RepID=A0A397SFR1_9GLOM|nr:major facilitator superfamily domain-containing protein [Glomus cerebriforme]
MSQEINNHNNIADGTSAIIEIPENNATTTSTSEAENSIVNNSNVKDEKSNQDLKMNLPSENRDVEMANIKNEKSNQNQGQEVEIEEQPYNDRAPLTKTRLSLVFIGLAFGIFLAALDQTIVATALHAIANEFSALDQIAWVGTAYLLTATAFQPTYGKLADIFGRKITFLIAIFLFELGSLICGLSPNMTCLIIARAIAGTGGGGIIGLVFIIISDIVSLQDRGKYQGIVGGVFGISSIVGPLLGGAFTDSITWRWAFYINLPFGVITIICVIFFLRLPYISGSLLEKFKRIDFLGTFVLVCSTIALLLPLNWGGSKYKWDSPVIIVLLCVGALGFIIFAFVEKYIAIEPIAPGRLFKDRMVAACFAVNFFQGMAFFGMVYFTPLFFQIVKGATATRAGLEILPLILAVVFTVIFTGQLVSRTTIISYKLLCIIGGILIITGAGLMSTFSDTSTRGELIGYLLISGIGIGAIMQTTLLASQQVVAYEDLASVTSLLTFFRTIGAVFGVAILGTVFNNGLSDHLPGGGSGHNGFEGGELGNVPNSIMRAFVLSFDISFKVVIVMGALTLISALFMKNIKPARDVKGESEKVRESN